MLSVLNALPSAILVPIGRLCVTLAKQKLGMERSGRVPTALSQAGWPCRSAGAALEGTCS